MPHRDLKDILIVFALEMESRGGFDDLNVVHCGVGKVNAAYRCAKALEGWLHRKGKYPELVLNLGSAGSTTFNTGSIVNCTKFIQRDFDVTAFGTPPYTTPFENVLAMLTNGERYEGFPEGICGTGDNFSTDGGPSNWNVVDMEAYSFAKICMFEKVPFGCLKYITDGADGQAADSWDSSVHKTAKLLRDATDSIFKG